MYLKYIILKTVSKGLPAVKGVHDTKKFKKSFLKHFIVVATHTSSREILPPPVYREERLGHLLKVHS